LNSIDELSLTPETAQRLTRARSLGQRPPDDYLVPYRSIGHLLDLRAQETPEKSFLIHFDKGGGREELSFGEFNCRVNQLANYMQSELGIALGERIATIAYNHSLTVLLYFAAWKIGATVAPQNVAEDDQRLSYVIDNSEAKVVFTLPELAERARRLASTLDKVEKVVVLDEEQLERIWSGSDDFVPISQPTLADEALLVYTSGTTGPPKGVVLIQYNLLVDALGISLWQGITGNQRMMCVLPIHHVNGTIVTIVTPMLVGASTVLNRAYSSSTFWKRIAEEKVNVVSVVPTLLQFSLEYADQRESNGESIWGNGIERVDLTHFRHLICGAGTLAVSLATRFEERFRFPIVHGYGLSETTCYSCFLPIDLDWDSHRDWMSKHGYPSIGCPILPNEMAIFAADGSGEMVAEGERGEICARGHNVMKYYYQRPDANEETFRFDWFRSGDEGFFLNDERGRQFFFITGRIKELINRGGVKFSPFDIEEVLLTIPGVKVGLAVGFENDYYGEEIGAYVVLDEGSTLSDDEILHHCRAELGFAKGPKVVVFGLDIPVTTTGKYQRLKLRERFAAWRGTQFRAGKQA